MNRFCVSCEVTGRHEEKEVRIPVGRKEFSTCTRVCQNCGAYALTPKVRKEMDCWAEQFTSNFIEIQPMLSKVVLQDIEETSEKYGLPKVAYMRLLTAFYLIEVISDPDFKEWKKFMRDTDSYKVMTRGTRAPTSIPIRYKAFKQLEVFAQLWNMTLANAMEEAILFGVGLKHWKDSSKLLEMEKRLERYIQVNAMAA